MLLNVHISVTVQSNRSYNPLEVFTLVGTKYLGKQVVISAPDTTLISGLISALIIQAQLGSIVIYAPYAIEKDGVDLDTTQTLTQAGLVENDLVKLRVHVFLT